MPPPFFRKVATGCGGSGVGVVEACAFGLAERAVGVLLASGKGGVATFGRVASVVSGVRDKLLLLLLLLKVLCAKNR